LSEEPKRPRSSRPGKRRQPKAQPGGESGNPPRRNRRAPRNRHGAENRDERAPGAERQGAAPEPAAAAAPGHEEASQAASPETEAAETPAPEPAPIESAVAAPAAPAAEEPAAAVAATDPEPDQTAAQPVEGGRVPAGPRKSAAVADEKPQRGFYERFWATGLPSVGAIARRELSAYFVSPIGYVVAAVLVLPVSFLGYLARLGQGLPVTMDPIFGLIALLMVFFTPLYTMRLLAEEKRNGTLEILLTSPVRDWELVTGKWLGGFLFYMATIAFTVFYVVLVSIYTPTHYPASILGLHFDLPTVDYGRIVAGYIGVALVGAAWVAIGLFASSLTSNQIIAAVLGVGLLLAFQYLFATLSTFLVPPYSNFFDYLNAAGHAASFSAGRLVPRDAIYFLTLTIAALFLTTRVIESRKWR
jgi:ABC-2 type transport system permease protein